MSFPDTPKRSRRVWYIAGGILAALVIAGGTTAVVLALSGGNSGPAATSPSATPVANGVSRPDPSCVTTDGKDHQDYWNGNGWWAGRINGEIREMPANSVLLLKINGAQINSAWICAPRSNG